MCVKAWYTRCSSRYQWCTVHIFGNIIFLRYNFCEWTTDTLSLLTIVIYTYLSVINKSSARNNMSSPVITKVIEHESTFNGQLPLPVNVPKVLNPSLGLAFTVSLWVTAKSIPGATCLVSLGRNPQNYFNEMMLQIKGNKISYFEYANGPNSFEVLTPDVVGAKFLLHRIYKKWKFSYFKTVLLLCSIGFSSSNSYCCRTRW